MAREAYAAEGDLLIGDIALGPAYDKNKFLDDAADEMDTYIGQRYEVPVDMSSVSGLTAIKLKQINARLASGRLILAVAAAGEDDSLHAYGMHLLNQAMGELYAIQAGTFHLVGDSVAPLADADIEAGPTIFNKDEDSFVDSFYDEFARGPNFKRVL